MASGSSNMPPRIASSASTFCGGRAGVPANDAKSMTLLSALLGVAGLKFVID